MTKRATFSLEGFVLSPTADAPSYTVTVQRGSIRELRSGASQGRKAGRQGERRSQGKGVTDLRVARMGRLELEDWRMRQLCDGIVSRRKKGQRQKTHRRKGVSALHSAPPSSYVSPPSPESIYESLEPVCATSRPDVLLAKLPFAPAKLAPLDGGRKTRAR